MSIPTLTASDEVEATRRPRVRLDFLDGLRGLASLYILLFHAFCHTTPLFPRGLQRVVYVCGDGTYVVGVFIVLSGYCLMLPVTGTADGNLPKGFGDYIKRRARRIIPPYYAALILGLAAICVTQLPKYLSGHANQITSPLTQGDLISHLLLVHNFNVNWANGINGAMWSVATEWQIYFLFPLLLLPLWRRFGNGAAVVSGFAVGLIPYYLTPFGHQLSQARFWFIGLFALGMAGAAIAHSPRYLRQRQRFAVHGGWLALVLYALSCAVGFRIQPAVTDLQVSLGNNAWMFHALIGGATAALLVYCAHHAMNSGSRVPPVLRLLESRAAILLGSFSYSLYLTHEFIFNWFSWAVPHLHLSPLHADVMIWIVMTPVALGAAYLFHLVFERPFLSGFQKQAEQRAETLFGSLKRLPPS